MMRAAPASPLFPYTTLFRSIRVSPARDKKKTQQEKQASATPSLKTLPQYACRLPVYQYRARSEEHTSELQSHSDLVCRLLLEKKKNKSEERHPIGSSRARAG